MPLSQLLKHFPGRRQIIGTMVIPGALTTFLALLPWIDWAFAGLEAEHRKAAA